MKTRILVALVALLALAACSGSFLSPTIVIQNIATVYGSAKDPSTAADPQTAAGCPIDQVSVSGEIEMAVNDIQRLDATPFFRGQELSKECALALPKKWAALTPGNCELLGAVTTHNPDLRAKATGSCEVTFSQGGVALADPFVVRIK